MKDKPIFSPDIAGELIERGFEIKNQRRDYDDPHKWVYFFKSTPEMLRAFDEIQRMRDITKKK